MILKNTKFAACLIALASGVAATEAVECPDLGLENAFLSDHFCAQLLAIVPGEGAPTGTTRSITQEGNPDLPQGEEWANFPMFQDAYRADPRKTLELIERIKGAGGLPVGNN